jgi:hypothetical protein
MRLLRAFYKRNEFQEVGNKELPQFEIPDGVIIFRTKIKEIKTPNKRKHGTV